ncbi:MAG: HEAT repeat domain-containing protein [Phycisphaerales bacterium]|nr:HEAT repeat domain-containing protein [Phycisphaerales bacterium]
MSRVVPLLLLLASIGGGCLPSGSSPKLNSPNARERAVAGVALANSGDRAAVHRLVPLLEDGDSAVRMMAILSLERLTGETLGYRYFDAETRRSEAVERWRAALREGRFEKPGGAPDARAGSGKAGGNSAAAGAE